MFSKILIANRAEIACRIIRTCKKLGIRTLAVYSEEEGTPLHAKLADEALCCGNLQDTYLNAEKICQVALENNCDALHPGYGFLSENADFSEFLAKKNISFIGPSSQAMKLMGDKISAKEFAAKAKVPMVPSCTIEPGQKQSEKKLEEFIAKCSFPLLIKAAAGGGGRGMRRVESKEDLFEQLPRAAEEAKKFFGDGNLFVEKCVDNARHVEVQVLGDKHGELVHLFTRDCSFQRNHQKVIEEAPAPFLKDETREALHSHAVSLCKSANYSNAGTVEFLVDADENIYFLEVNSRLQVEHPVTEAITGLDLVELQIKVAAGETLQSLLGSELTVSCCGHAIEARLCFEKPEQNFSVATGKLEVFNLPSSPHIRVDTGFSQGDLVTHYFDSLGAKIIASGKDRNTALEHLSLSLSNVLIAGVATNCGYLRRLIDHHSFAHGTHHIKLAESLIPSEQENWVAQQLATGLLALYKQTLNKDNTAWSNGSPFRVWGSSKQITHLECQGERFSWKVVEESPGNYHLSCQEPETSLYIATQVDRSVPNEFVFVRNGVSDVCRITASQDGHSITFRAGTFFVSERSPQLKTHEEDGAAEQKGQLTSPLPGTIVAVKVSVGNEIQEGDTLVILESMKMEHPLRADFHAIVKEVRVNVGDVVDAGAILSILQEAA